MILRNRKTTLCEQLQKFQSIFSSTFHFISVPTVAPAVSLSDIKTTTSLIISWTAIPEEYVTGELLGYHVTYKPVKIADQRIDETESLTVTAPGSGKHELTLDSLSSFTQYSITVAGYTAEGDGKTSEAVFGGKTIKKKTFHLSGELEQPFMWLRSLPG